MGKKSETVSMGTRSKSNKETKGSEGSKGKEEGPKAKGNAKLRLSSIERRMKALPPKGKTPAWISYYEHAAKDTNSLYGKGFHQPMEFFERLMESYVDSTDQLFDVLQQNPEACAVVFADGSGKMKVLHHLTAAIHGKPIIVGIEGFGSMSEVKPIHEELLVDKATLSESAERMMVPDLEDFLQKSIDDIDTSGRNDPGDGVSEYTSLGQVFASQPKAYLIHPKWLPLIYNTIGRTPPPIKINREFQNSEPSNF